MLQLFSKNIPTELPKERKKQLKELTKVFKIRVKSLSVLDRALTHSSFIQNAHEMIHSYERLEFLVDAILNAAVANLLYTQYPTSMEGRLTTLRAGLVDEQTLSEVGLEYDILSYVKLGKGETLEDFRAQRKVSADLMESLIATLYLDWGFNYAIKFVERILKSRLQHRLSQGTRDFKTRLQKWSVANYKQYPNYSIIGEQGPDHNKEFRILVTIGEYYRAEASGRSKKEAEQKAAEKVMQTIENKSEKGQLS